MVFSFWHLMRIWLTDLPTLNWDLILPPQYRIFWSEENSSTIGCCLTILREMSESCYKSNYVNFGLENRNQTTCRNCRKIRRTRPHMECHSVPLRTSGCGSWDRMEGDGLQTLVQRVAEMDSQFHSLCCWWKVLMKAKWLWPNCSVGIWRISGTCRMQEIKKIRKRPTDESRNILRRWQQVRIISVPTTQSQVWTRSGDGRAALAADVLDCKKMNSKLRKIVLGGCRHF